MTDYVIEIHNPLGDFTQIPNSLLNDERLSAEAVALMCWFLQNRTGWIIRQSDARKRFRWGKDRWQRVMRELREVGAVQSVDERDLKTGRVVAWRMVISALPWVTGERLDAPKNTPKVQRPDNPACGATTERSQRPDNPACGPDNPAGSGRIIRPLNKTTLAAAARAPKACAAAAAANKAENLGVLWARAEQAASQGLRWRNPESQTWHCAAEWGQGVD